MQQKTVQSGICAIVWAEPSQPFVKQPLEGHLLNRLAQQVGEVKQVLVLGGAADWAQAARQRGFTHLPTETLADGLLAAGHWQGYLLAPANLYNLRMGTLHTLCATFCKQPERIAVPVYGGRRGQLAVLPHRLRPQLEQGGQTLRQLVQAEAYTMLRVQVYDPGILHTAP